MREDFPQLQFEAAWELTNIASRTFENTKVVIDHGSVPIFVKLLASPSDYVHEKAVWALGNVVGDSPRCRDLVFGQGALLPLLAQLNEHAKLSMLRNATWTLSNFCRGKPQPPFEEENMKVARKGDMGFAPLYAENLDPSTTSKGDLKETFHIGFLQPAESCLNQWPSKGLDRQPSSHSEGQKLQSQKTLPVSLLWIN